VNKRKYVVAGVLLFSIVGCSYEPSPEDIKLAVAKSGRVCSGIPHMKTWLQRQLVIADTIVRTKPVGELQDRLVNEFTSLASKYVTAVDCSVDGMQRIYDMTTTREFKNFKIYLDEVEEYNLRVINNREFLKYLS